MEKNQGKFFILQVDSITPVNRQPTFFSYRSLKKNIPSLGLVYLPTWMVDFLWVNVGKYTVRPMDHMGGIAGWTQVLQGDKIAGNPTPNCFGGFGSQGITGVTKVLSTGKWEVLGKNQGCVVLSNQACCILGFENKDEILRCWNFWQDLMMKGCKCF